MNAIARQFPHIRVESLLSQLQNALLFESKAAHLRGQEVTGKKTYRVAWGKRPSRGKTRTPLIE